MYLSWHIHAKSLIAETLSLQSAYSTVQTKSHQMKMDIPYEPLGHISCMDINNDEICHHRALNVDFQEKATKS